MTTTTRPGHLMTAVRMRCEPATTDNVARRRINVMRPTHFAFKLAHLDTFRHKSIWPCTRQNSVNRRQQTRITRRCCPEGNAIVPSYLQQQHDENRPDDGSMCCTTRRRPKKHPAPSAQRAIASSYATKLHYAYHKRRGHIYGDPCRTRERWLRRTRDKPNATIFDEK